MANVITKLLPLPGFRMLSANHLNDWATAINKALNGTQQIGGINSAGNVAAAFFDVSTGNGLTAVGTNRATALVLANGLNTLSTVGPGTGALLPSAAIVGIGGAVIVFNQDATNAAQIYGTGSDTIDTVAGSTGVVLTHAKRCLYFVVAANTWISAQLGVVSA